MGQKQLVPH